MKMRTTSENKITNCSIDKHSETMDATSLHAPVLSGLNLPWHKLLHLAVKLTSPIHASVEHMASCVDFFYLAHGRLMVTHLDADGRERAIFYLGPGNLFNEASACAGFDAPNSPFICDQECVYFRFSHSLLHDPAFIVKYPDLIINLMTGLGIKVLIHHTSLSNFAGIPAITRLSRFFISLAKKHNSLNFDPAMTQEAMAALLGMNRATMVRSLRELKQKGAILCSTKHILKISDLELLRKLSEI